MFDVVGYRKFGFSGYNSSNAVKPETKARVYDAVKKQLCVFLHENLQLRKNRYLAQFSTKNLSGSGCF